MIMVSNSTKKKIVIGIVVLGLLGLLVFVGMHLWYKYGSSGTNSSSINRSIANFTEVLPNERIFYLPVLTPTTTTVASKVSSSSNSISNSNIPVVILNNNSGGLG